MKKLILSLLLCGITCLLHAQCNCFLQVTATKKNAIAGCTNGSITATINGNICGSLTLAIVSLMDSATSAIIESQYTTELPGFVYFGNVPAGIYKVRVNHTCSPADSIYIAIAAVVSNPDFIHNSTDVTLHGCNDGTIGLEITGDYCPATLNIVSDDTLLHNPVTFTQTSYCSFCYVAENLKAGIYKVDVSDAVNTVHHIHYVTINEPPCNFYITANQGRLEACTNETMTVHLLGDYCLSNTFTLRLYNSSMKLKDSLINQVLNDTLVHFNNVKKGTYTVTATYANSCISTATATIKKYCPLPFNLRDSAADVGSRLLRWSGYPCLSGYELSYKRKGTSAWQIITLTGASATSATLNGLTLGAIYQWRVRSKCSATSKSDNTPTKSFTVPNSARLLYTLDEQDIFIHPNPTDGIFNVTLSGASAEKITERIYNGLGEIIFNRPQCSADETYNLADYPKGVYLLKVDNGNSVLTQKIVH